MLASFLRHFASYPICSQNSLLTTNLSVITLILILILLIKLKRHQLIVLSLCSAAALQKTHTLTNKWYIVRHKGQGERWQWPSIGSGIEELWGCDRVGWVWGGMLTAAA